MTTKNIYQKTLDEFRERNTSKLLAVGNVTGTMSADTIQRWKDESKRQEELLCIDFDPQSVWPMTAVLDDEHIQALRACGVTPKPIVENLITVCRDRTTREKVAYFVKQDGSDDIFLVIPSKQIVVNARELRKAHNDDHNNLRKNGVRDEDGRVFIHGFHVANASADWSYMHLFAGYHCESDMGQLVLRASRFIRPVTVSAHQVVNS